MRLIFFISINIMTCHLCLSQVCINEIVSSNASGIRDIDQDFCDWIEIYNTSEEPFDITGFSLTDDKSIPGKWIFPERTLESHEYLVVYANGKSYEYYTNFKLDADSERVYLFDPSGLLIDSAGGVQMYMDISLGRRHDGGPDWCFQGFPTPGEPNSAYGAGPVRASGVFITPQGGEFSDPFHVTLASQNPNDSIFFTTDGSIPGRDAELYTAPFLISENTVIRARIIKYNVLPGPVATTTFVTGRDHDIPVVCLSTEQGNLWDEEYGIYTFGLQPVGEYPYYEANFWKDWERPVHFELYNTQGIRQVDQDLGLKIYGAWSRAYDQKSFALYARKSYGKGSLEYRFFKDKPITKFESIILRNSGDDNNGLQFQDCFLTGLTRDMDIDRQAYQPAAVYINGEYWGLLNLREKISTDFVASNHLVDADSVNLLEGPGDVISGTNEGYLALTNYLELHDSLQRDEDYKYVRDKIDVDNFLKYEITEIYLNNRDWPGNNIKFWSTVAPGSKWRWILFDTDAGFGIWNTEDYAYNTLEFALETDGPEFPNPPWSTLLLRRLFTNTECRNSFIIQFCDRLNLDFHPDRIKADLDSFQELYVHEMSYHFDRWWGDYDEWFIRINNRKIFGENRPAYCREFLTDRFNLGAELYVKLDVSDTVMGFIKINTIYPGKYPFTGIYFQDLPVQLTAIPKPGYKFIKWEGSVNSEKSSIIYDMATEGIFTAVFAEAGHEDVSVIINEINYASSSSLDTKDWIELYNNGTTSVDLGGWTLLDSGIDSGYVFEPGTVLLPGGYIVVCRNLNDFRKFNPQVTNSVGNLAFRLSSEGEMIYIFNSDGQMVDAVNYKTMAPWPVDANGTGKTLELKDPLLDNSNGVNWQAIKQGGTPGAVNSVNSVPVNSIAADPDRTMLDCFPNPFRNYTTISFTVSSPGRYRLEIMDMQGRTVRLLTENDLPGGLYWVDWITQGEPAGVYTIRLTGDRVMETKKVIKIW